MIESCVEHSQGNSNKGYGVGYWEGKNGYLHRRAYAFHHGLSRSELDGVVIRHTCDNPRCVNPPHLVAGTTRDNMRDMVIRGRSTKGERNSRSKLTSQQVKEIRSTYQERCPLNGGRALSRKYNVHPNTISAVVNGVNWS